MGDPRGPLPGIRHWTIPDRFCATAKIMPERSSVHTQERLWQRDFCDGAKLRRAGRSRKCSVTYRIGFVPYFGAVNTYSARHGSKISRSDDLNPLRREQIFRSGDWNLVHQTLSANRRGTMFDVCERLVPSWALAVHTIPDGFSWPPRQPMAYSVNIPIGLIFHGPFLRSTHEFKN